MKKQEMKTITREQAVKMLAKKGIILPECNILENVPAIAEQKKDYISMIEFKFICSVNGIENEIVPDNSNTKKAEYSRMGIIYKGSKILSPIGYIAELLKAGNDKTGKAVFTFSLLPGTMLYEIIINGIIELVKGTCCCNCPGCYAKTGRYNCDNVLQSMGINTYLVNNYPEFVQAAINAQLASAIRGEVRIHAAGDFNTNNPEQYANMWLEIAKKNNTFRFWTYTKVTRFETLFDGLKNANIVKSIIPSIGFNFGHCDYIINAYYTLKAMGKSVYICKCGIDRNQHCEKCGVCATYEYVLFLEHSTDYKAELDPLYDKFVDLVNNQ